jgi:hypothetical protein
MEGRNGRCVVIPASGPIRVLNTDNATEMMEHLFHGRASKLVVPTDKPDGAMVYASRPQAREAAGQQRPVNELATRVLGELDEMCKDCCGRGWEICEKRWPLFGTVVVTGGGACLAPRFDVPERVIEELCSAASGATPGAQGL